jgi:hypothetical protein
MIIAAVAPATHETHGVLTETLLCTYDGAEPGDDP